MTSRTPPRTSTGWCRKAEEDRITRTCRLLFCAASALALAGPADAARRVESDPARTYVEARAAAFGGDHARSAELLARLVDSSAADSTVAHKAVAEAISAGAVRLALRLAAKIPEEELPVEAKLLRLADELRDGKSAAALQRVSASGTELDFLRPYLAAWSAAERRDLAGALAALDQVNPGAALASAGDEQRAAILLKFRRTAEADPLVRRAVAGAGPRTSRLRLGFAEQFVAAGDRGRAVALLAGMDVDSARARDRILSGRSAGLAIDDEQKAFAELMLRLALELNSVSGGSVPIALAQIATHAAPDDATAAIMLGMFLNSRGRVDDAVAALRSVPEDSPVAPQAKEAEARTLLDSKRGDQALAIAYRAASRSDADVSDVARLADVLSALDRHVEAADAYARALRLAEARPADERWPLLLLQANALESAGRWPEARAALQAALRLAPEQPVILNFLGYAKLERGEDLDVAEAMIRKASALAPDDPSITDSLGWALYKRGRLQEAIETLQRAARSDPDQAEIHEHLGDALYKAGRRFEARFAWHAALTTAEDEMAKRINAKIENGLTVETAAP